MSNELCREGNEEWVAFDQTPYCSTSAFDAASPILHEVTACLQSLNIPVEQVELFFLLGTCMGIKGFFI